MLCRLLFVSFGYCIVCLLMALITPFVSLDLSYCFMKKHLVRKGYVIFTLPKQLLFPYWCEIVLYSFLYFCSVAIIICLSLSFKICLRLIWHSIISFLIYFKKYNVVLTPYPLADPEKKAFHGWYLPLRI